MSDLTLKIPSFAGVVKNLAPELLEPSQLADAENFLPAGPRSAAGKVKVWHKDLLRVQGSTDDRIVTTAAVTLVNAAPEAPANVVATALSGPGKRIEVTWDAVTGAASYTLYFATVAGGPYTSLGARSSGYVHTGLTDGVTYYYVVTATCQVEGAQSTEASATANP